MLVRRMCMVYVVRRTNIYLPDEQVRALKRLGAQRRTPVSELIREAVAAWLRARRVRVVADTSKSAREVGRNGPLSAILLFGWQPGSPRSSTSCARGGASAPQLWRAARGPRRLR